MLSLLNEVKLVGTYNMLCTYDYLDVTCELVNSKLNPEFTKSHSNIFMFTCVLNLKIPTDSELIMK